MADAYGGLPSLIRISDFSRSVGAAATCWFNVFRLRVSLTKSVLEFGTFIFQSLPAFPI